MNILPKKRNVLLSIKEEPKPVEVVELTKNEEEKPEENILEAPTNDEIFKQVEEGLSREEDLEKPPEVPHNNIIEADPETQPKKKKKRKLSEKQLLHLAKMRQKALARRKQLREAKAKEKELKRIEKEQKKKAKLLEKEKKRKEIEERKKAEREYIEAQENAMNKHIQSKSKPVRSVEKSSSISKDDMDFQKFFNYMERYDRIKQVRKRQQQRQPNIAVKKPNNKYLGNMIPF